jgi:hypothetical protein
MTSTRSGVLEAVDRILNRGGDADDVLRQVVAVLHRLYPYVAIAFVEEDELVVGPEAGTSPARTEVFPISFQGSRVAELRVGEAPTDREFLERVATVVSPYCLVGWDTGGEPWTP